MASSSASANKDVVTKLTVLMLWLLLGVFVVYPLCRLFAMTFWVDGSFTLSNLRPFIDNWYDRQSAINSILLGCSVGVAGTALGFIFAFAPMKGGRLKSAQPLYRIFLTDKDLHIKGKMFGYAESDYDLIAYSRFFLYMMIR